jgi:hypothetical protein
MSIRITEIAFSCYAVTDKARAHKKLLRLWADDNLTA